MSTAEAPMRTDLPPVMDPVADDLASLEVWLRDDAGVALPALRELLDLVFSSGGKRIRPALVFATVRLGEADHDATMNQAAGIETLHAATLVHDDLIDRALTRRGLPTLNRRWDAGATVLAGDWLFARAAGFVARTGNVRVVQIFARTLGSLSDGELRQLFGRRGVPTMAEYEHRIYSKTASLFECATESSAELLGLSERDKSALARFGRELGCAFQIIDDILDFTSDETTLGKPVGNDLRSGTITLPAMAYLESHPDAAPWLHDYDGEPQPDDVEALIAAVRGEPSALQAARDEARRRVASAIAALRTLPPSSARDDLERLADYTLDRQF